MKCPKCGYASFEYLDECRKCGRDLVKFKEEAGIYMVRPGGFGGLGLVVASSMEVAEDVAVAEESGETISQESQEDEEGIVIGMEMETETSQEVEKGAAGTEINVEEESTIDMTGMEEVSEEIPFDMSTGDESLGAEVSEDDISVMESPDEAISQEDEKGIDIDMEMKTETSQEVEKGAGDVGMNVGEVSGAPVDIEDKKEESEPFISVDEDYGDIDIDDIDIDIGDDDIPSDDKTSQ